MQYDQYLVIECKVAWLKGRPHISGTAVVISYRTEAVFRAIPILPYS